MTVDLEALREHVGAGPSDDDLQRLLDAALEAITVRYGPADADPREYLRPFGQWVRLGRRAESVTTLLEGGVELDPDADPALFEIWPGGRYLRRLDADGDSLAWSGWVDVTYTPVSDASQRDRVTVALVDLDLNRSPGLSGITVGPWSEQYGSDEDHQAAREAILASMRPASIGVW